MDPISLQNLLDALADADTDVAALLSGEAGQETDLAGLESEALRIFDDIRTRDVVSEEDVAALEQLADGIEAIRTEQGRRDEAAAEQRSRIDELAGRVHTDDDTDGTETGGETGAEDEADDDAGPTPDADPAAEGTGTGDGTASDAGPEPEPVPEPVSAAATAPTPAPAGRPGRRRVDLGRVAARRGTPAPPAEQASPQLRAAADQPGYANGHRFTDLEELAEAAIRRFVGMPRGAGAPRMQNGVAVVAKEYPTELVASGTGDDMDVLEHATSETRLSGGSLTAAGGWCYGPGMLVTTPGGLVPIEEIEVGDQVVIGSGAVRTISAVFTREAERLELRAQGVVSTVTAEHPIWARRNRITAGGLRARESHSADGNVGRPGRPGLSRFEDPEFIPAGDLRRGDQIALPLPAGPEVQDSFLGDDPDVAQARAYILGRYLGDGWTSRKRKAANGRADMDASYLCSAHGEAEHLEKQLLLAEIGFNRREYPTVTQFGLRSAARDWFAELGAGRSARDKQVPASAMHWPADMRAALLAGYCAADGHESQRGGQSRRISVSTVSRALAVSVAMLVRSLGHTPTFSARSSANESWVDGRKIDGSSESYRVQWAADAPMKRHAEHDTEAGIVWVDVASVDPVDVGDVYDVTVDDPEHTFIVDGVLVHNCAPSETLYELCEMEGTDGLISVPEMVASRGGVRWTQGPDFTSIFDNTGFIQTEADAIAGTEKPCFEIPCPDFEECRLDAIGLCLTAGILQNRGYPEVVARFIRGALKAHAHRYSGVTLERMEAGSTAVTVPGGPGATASVLGALDLMATDYRYRHRLADSATLEVVAPRWLRGVIRSDLAKRNGVNLLSVSNAQIDGYFRDRQVSVQWVYNWQDALFPTPPDMGGDPLPTAWPDEVKILMYSAGTWVRATSDIITLDAVYDSALFRQNRYNALFTEEGLCVIQKCPDSRVITIPVCPDGATGEQRAHACPSS